MNLFQIITNIVKNRITISESTNSKFSMRFLSIHPIVYAMLLFLMGCSAGNSYNFDNAGWENDKNGCENFREKIYKDVLADKSNLLKLNEKQLVKALGSPDKNELSRRNQKFFIYNIISSEDCPDQERSSSLYFIVRFNAVGLSSEIFISETPGPFI